MKRVWPAALFLLATACPGPKQFHLSGTVTLAPHFKNKTAPPNAMLFVVVRNLGGVPLAVRRIVNPQFPASFSVENEDLVVPGSFPAGPLEVSVELNSHGRVGSPSRGDLLGAHPDPVEPGETGIHVVIEREIPGAALSVPPQVRLSPATATAVSSPTVSRPAP